MQETDELPGCPSCGGSSFRRDSIFEERQEHGQTTGEFAVATPPADSDWLEDVRVRLPQTDPCLAFKDGEGEIHLFAIERGWTRIGRSLTADIRLDDPSVSRRHALVVAEPGKPLRVLDDRSLNGIFVNGEVVEWAALEDGDELTVGSFHLFLLQR